MNTSSLVSKVSVLRGAMFVMLLSAASAWGTVLVTATSNGGPIYAEADGDLLLTGSLFRVGYFDLGSASVLATLQASNDYGAVNSLFTPLAELVAGAGGVNQAGNTGSHLVINSQFASGQVFGQITGINSSYLPTLSDLSVWVFNGASAASSTQWGIYSAWDPMVTNNGWEFPADSGLESLKTTEVNMVVRGTQDVPSNQLRLSVIPEPSGVMLVAASACLLVARRRRAERVGVVG
jgi:hypothetical protein